jgi:uncharacterized protein YbaP (TraB family)
LLGVVAFAAVAAPSWAETGAGAESFGRSDVAAYRAWVAGAAQGDADAQYSLGLVYELGKGRLQNSAEAAKWYRKAAEQGHLKAQVGLGALHARGEGVPQDLVRAYVLFDLAYEQGFAVAADYRDGVAVHMTAAQFREARQLAIAARQSAAAIFQVQGAEGERKERASPARAGAGKRELVAAGQRGLAALGYESGPVDGIAGPITEAAVRTFQTDLGLVIDGEVTEALVYQLEAALQASHATEPLLHGTGLLWMVEGAAERPSYVFGTMHSRDARVLDLPPTVAQVFAEADSVTIEMRLAEGDTIENHARKLFRSMLFSDERTLEQVAGKKLFAKVMDVLAPYGVKAAALQRFKPWVVFFVISQSPANLEGAAEDELVLDLWLAQGALDRGKPVYGLETMEEQLAVFDGMPEKDQVALLESAVDYAGERTSWLNEFRAHYLVGDIAAIMQYTIEPARRMGPAYVRTLVKRLIDDRNKVMVERMATLLTQGNAFIAIGAAHLPGEAGILHLLELRGYRISRIH